MKQIGRTIYCQLPSVGSVSGRSSSITNAFVNAIIPIVTPTPEEELKALAILEMNPEDIRCAYCGDKSTEWDHLRAIIKGQQPTGFITELANLIPACGKCNQSKGASDWKKWMLGPARLSPKMRNIPDVELRAERIARYESSMTPTCLDFEELVGAELWTKHRQNWKDVLALLESSQKLATEIRTLIASKHSLR